MENKIILPSVYLGNIQWYSKVLLSNEIILEQHEHYIKQTWRNRTRIIGANGIQDLVIPVHAPNHTPMKDVLINYSEDWQRQHWQAIRSAYGNAPFFEFYADYFSSFYEKKISERLIDFNFEILKLTLRLLKIEKEIIFSQEYISTPEGSFDLRSLISPKEDLVKDSSFVANRYLQVFEERHDFVPNASIIDLLCCQGTSAGEVLRQSTKNNI